MSCGALRALLILQREFFLSVEVAAQLWTPLVVVAEQEAVEVVLAYRRQLYGCLLTEAMSAEKRAPMKLNLCVEDYEK